MMSNPLDRFRLDGRTALVTGARREIGRAIALALAGVGARVAVHHTGTAQEAADAAAVVAEAGNGAGAFAADFSIQGAAQGLAQDVQAAFGGVDIDRTSFTRQIEVNLFATLALTQALLPGMQARGWGRVLTIGSVQQNTPHPQMLVYAGSKAMQHNWAVNLARQVGPQGITVNNLAPGVIATARNRDQLATEGAALLARIPVGRIGAPEDLVGAALLLCSPAGAYINGANLFVDGGRHVT